MPKVAANKNPEITAAQAATVSEEAAVEFWERHRWGDTRACVHCGDVNVYQMRSLDGGRDRRFRWRCRGCNKQYTVKVGTVMEGSNVPLRHWTLALWLYASSKKGFAAKQFQRMTGLSYKSALFVAHRMRYAMTDGLETPLSGVVEVDETYVGGKPRKPTQYQRDKAAAEGREIPKPKRGRGTSKIPVVAMVERGGRVIAAPVTSVNAANLQAAIRLHCSPSARIITDEFAIYNGVGAFFEGGHRTVAHGKDEYVRKEADGTKTHTNTVEGVFSLLKRGLLGVHHSVSPRHLHRYVNEMAWRYSRRHIDDGERMLELIACTEGRRLANRNSAAL